MLHDNKIAAKPSENGFAAKRTSNGTTELSRCAGKRMDVEFVRTWLEQCPVLEGNPLNFNYLPSYSGWSLTIPKAETHADILGNRRERWQLKITRRQTIQSNEDRLAVVEALEDLAAWTKAHPPENTRLKVTGLPEFTSRNNSGIEDISITIQLEES